jgi:hypothetical protein
MPNRRLSGEELTKANTLLDEIRSRLDDLSGGDREVRFALNRKVYKELSYDERSKPSVRKRLKELKFKEQDGLCPKCGKPLGERYNVLDRLTAVDGYTAKNTQLVHPHCDYEGQASKRYT